MSNAVLQALGDELVSKDGTVKTSEALKGKTVLGLYFSAHWCPPCRKFTPILSEKYTKLKNAGKEFELVFVSSDRSQKDFDEYHGSMSFMAMPYSNRDGKEELSDMFEIEGIPSLVFVDAETGKLITDEGREEIMKDKFIENFPYTPKPFDFFGSLGDQLLNKDGKIATSEALKGKSVLGLYFSAHWCPPCRGFTPNLCKKYTALKEAGKDFEMVFLSSDQDQKQFEEYHAEMNFLAMPYENRDGKAALSKKFGVSGIPCLVFVDAKTGDLITDEGRSGVSSPTFIEDFPYHPKPCNDLGSTTKGIDSKSSLILFMEDSSKEEQKQYGEIMTQIATEEKSKPDNQQHCKNFFTATSGGPLPQIRKGCKMTMTVTKHEHELKKAEGSNWGCDGCEKGGENASGRFRCTEGCDFDYCDECHEKSNQKSDPRPPALVILNLKDKGKYYKIEPLEKVDATSIRAFMKDFAEKKLTPSQWE
jgi:nucleoredoxin